MNNHRLESAIDRAYLELSTATTPELRRGAFHEMQRLIKRRSPGRVAEMEIDQGIDHAD